jgi:hypothetical protein
MATLHVENFPDDLFRQMKKQAIDDCTTFREWVIQKCGARMAVPLDATSPTQGIGKIDFKPYEPSNLPVVDHLALAREAQAKLDAQKKAQRLALEELIVKPKPTTPEELRDLLGLEIEPEI